MFIRCIAIYGVDDNDKYQIIRFADKDTKDKILQPDVSTSYLHEFEHTFLFERRKLIEIDYTIALEDTHPFYYVKKKKYAKSSSQLAGFSEVLIVIVTQQKLLEDKEFEMLMTNIEYILQRQINQKTEEELYGVTFAHIIGAPLEFSQRSLEVKEKVANDPKIFGVKKEVAAVKAVMLKNIGAVLERGETIEELVEKSDALKGTALKFAATAKSLNDEDTCFGKIRNRC